MRLTVTTLSGDLVCKDTVVKKTDRFHVLAKVVSKALGGIPISLIHRTDRLRMNDRIGDAGVQDGDTLTCVARLPQTVVVSTRGGAFAAVKDDGSVITWGNVDYGGNSNTVLEQLHGIQNIYATENHLTA